MLVIRNEQLQHFDLMLREQYLDQACRHLRTELCDVIDEKSDATLREHAIAALHRALGYGMQTHEEHLGYLTVTAVLGWNFYTEPDYAWVGECLANRLLGTPSARLQSVLQALGNELGVTEEDKDDAEEQT